APPCCSSGECARESPASSAVRLCLEAPVARTRFPAQAVSLLPHAPSTGRSSGVSSAVAHGAWVADGDLHRNRRDFSSELSGFYPISLQRPRCHAALRKSQLRGCRMGSATLLAGRSILVVEDEALITFELVNLFESVGAHVVAVRTCE